MKAVIFDFNGTMFFDTDKHDASWKRFLENLCKRRITQEELDRYNVHGRTNKVILEHFTGTLLSDAHAHELSEQKEAMYRELCLQDRARFHLANGVSAYLDFLKEKGIPRTIATASGKSNLDFYISEFHLARWFDTNRIIYNDGTVRGKPDPDLYLRAANTLGADVKDCLVIEDSPLGTLAAKRAGIGTIFAISPGNHASAFTATAQKVIADFTDPALYAWLDA
ncbi:HAD family hydrolase [Christensenella tenuis]|jgi:HAD superfamily hydrolase (TIGR01509 family)|uniref:HAD family phosphatase n=1 Tax=Christensenella tenuis TaxID=2763033 RepID=A0ABR7ECJ1_9FIRM|nr:HAD family phosphatase [Christensenella tenuis]MBC5646819.1 HAD family phosphatase [Christensenella tenuis]